MGLAVCESYLTRFLDPLKITNLPTTSNDISSIMQFIGLKNIDEEVLTRKIAHGAEPNKSATFRSGGHGGWHDVFTSSHVKQTKIAAPDLVSSLEYELDEDWGIERRIINTSCSNYSEINTQTLMKLATKRITIDWNDYLELRNEFLAVTDKSQSYAPHHFDEWALFFKKINE